MASAAPSIPQGLRRTTSEEERFYCKTQIPDIAGTYSGVVIIVGGGKTMWEELEAVNVISKHHDIIAVNIAGMLLPRVDHLFSWHKKQISLISKFRYVEYPGEKHLCHSVNYLEGLDYTWFITGQSSTSGLSSIHLAWLLGYKKIILVGVPLDGSGYFYKPSINKCLGDNDRGKEIDRMYNDFKDNVRSMSGRTKEVFGSPDTKWIRS